MTKNKLFHLTDKSNINSIRKHGLVGVKKAKDLLRRETGTDHTLFNQQTYSILNTYGWKCYDLRCATFMFEEDSCLVYELLQLMNDDPYILEIEIDRLNKDKLFVFNTEIASHLLNYSKQDQHRLAKFYWNTAIPYNTYVQNKDKVNDAFQLGNIMYQAEYVYFGEISPKYIKNYERGKKYDSGRY